MASRSSFGTFNRFCNKRKASKPKGSISERLHPAVDQQGKRSTRQFGNCSFSTPAGRALSSSVSRASPLPERDWIVTVSPKAVMRSALSTSSRLLNHLCCRYLRIPAAALPDDPHTIGEKARWDCRDKRLRRLAVRESVLCLHCYSLILFKKARSLGGLGI